MATEAPMSMAMANSAAMAAAAAAAAANGAATVVHCPGSRKHVELSLELKRKLIAEHEHGVPFTLLGKKYHIATSTAANIWRKKDFFLRSRMSGSRKRCNDRSKYKIVNQVTALFVKSMLERNHKIDGEVIKRFARTAAAQCNFKDFHGSNGWLDSFKKRENVCWVRRRGTVASAVAGGRQDGQQQLDHYHQQQQPEQQQQQHRLSSSSCPSPMRRSDSPNLSAAASAAAAVAATSNQHLDEHRNAAALGQQRSLATRRCWTSPAVSAAAAAATSAWCCVAAAAAAVAALNSSDSLHERDHEIEDWFHGIPFLCQFFEEYHSMRREVESQTGGQSSGHSPSSTAAAQPPPANVSLDHQSHHLHQHHQQQQQQHHHHHQSLLNEGNSCAPSSSASSSTSITSSTSSTTCSSSTVSSSMMVTTISPSSSQAQLPVRSLSDVAGILQDMNSGGGGHFRASASMTDIQTMCDGGSGLSSGAGSPVQSQHMQIQQPPCDGAGGGLPRTLSTDMIDPQQQPPHQMKPEQEHQFDQNMAYHNQAQHPHQHHHHNHQQQHAMGSADGFSICGGADGSGRPAGDQSNANMDHLMEINYIDAQEAPSMALDRQSAQRRNALMAAAAAAAADCCPMDQCGQSGASDSETNNRSSGGQLMSSAECTSDEQEFYLAPHNTGNGSGGRVGSSAGSGAPNNGNEATNGDGSGGGNNGQNGAPGNQNGDGNNGQYAPRTLASDGQPDDLALHYEEISDHNDCCSDHYSDQQTGSTTASCNGDGSRSCGELQLHEYQGEHLVVGACVGVNGLGAHGCHYMDEYEYENISTIRHYPLPMAALQLGGPSSAGAAPSSAPGGNPNGANGTGGGDAPNDGTSSGETTANFSSPEHHQTASSFGMACGNQQMGDQSAGQSFLSAMSNESEAGDGTAPGSGNGAHLSPNSYQQQQHQQQQQQQQQQQHHHHQQQQQLLFASLQDQTVEHADHEEHNLLHNALMRSPEKLKLIDSIITLFNYASNYNQKMLSPLVEIKSCIERDLEVVLSDTTSASGAPQSAPPAPASSAAGAAANGQNMDRDLSIKYDIIGLNKLGNIHTNDEKLLK